MPNAQGCMPLQAIRGTPMQLDTPRSEDATVDQRPGADLTGCLNQAVASGDADAVGQAWQAVKAGSVQPDIDSLNTLLK